MPSLAAAKTPKYVLLADDLRRQIKRRVLLPGDRLPTFVEMRERHGVTSTTVDRIYAHLEKENLVVREQGRGTFVALPRVLPRTGIIGIGGGGFVTYSHPFYNRLMEGFQQVAGEAGFELLLLNGDLEISAGKVDGVLACEAPLLDEENFLVERETLSHLPPGMPCVTALINVRDVPSVLADEYQGAYNLTRHLLQRGHRRIAMLYDPFSAARLAGHRNALRDAKIREVELRRRAVLIGEKGYVASGHDAMFRWLKENWAALGCTALMAQNDDVAIGAIHALREMGVSVPEQVSVTGFDGTEVGRYFQPRLTSVEMPLREIGAVAMELLLRKIRGEQLRASTTVLPTRVIEGASVRSLASDRSTPHAGSPARGEKSDAK